VASLLACLLRANYPSVCCYCFEPPGCTVSLELADYLESFCTSVVMGDDLVPRISRLSLDMFKNDISRMIKTCNHPKFQILGSFLGARLAWLRSNKLERQGILHRRTPDGKLAEKDMELIKRKSSSFKIGYDTHHTSFTINYPLMFVSRQIILHGVLNTHIYFRYQAAFCI
jgi:hypothetical protein